MLSKIIITILCFFLVIPVFAQKNDSVFVVPNGNHWMIMHKVKKGETLFMLARRFHVDPSVIADANAITTQTNIKDNTLISIPVGEANILRYQPEPKADARPIYHRVSAEDNLLHLGKCSGVSQRTLQQWNALPDNFLKEKQVLLVGWILYDAAQISMAVEAAPVTKGNTVSRPGMVSTSYTMPAAPKQPQVPPMQKLYIAQTNNDSSVTTEKGMGVFFDNGGTHVGKVYYAFHNGTERGTIIKVYNPGNSKTIYVKVMGPIPPGKQYYNAVIGISATAKEELGVTDDKVWCELSYRSE